MQISLTDRLAAGRPVVVSRTWQVIGSRDCSAMILEYDKANLLVTRGSEAYGGAPTKDRLLTRYQALGPVRMLELRFGRETYPK